MRLIVATRNKGKLREIKEILRGLDMRIVSLVDLKRRFRIVENGKTFKENAAKKAIPVSRVYKDDYVLGEDSGLVVKCLGGLPGVYSKRYAGKSGIASKNNSKLLKELSGLPASKRSAYFCCDLVIARAGKPIKRFEGRLNGCIHNEAKGTNGFGYDPVFYLPKYKKTVAQLPLATKNKISHRAKAFQKLKVYLKTLTVNG